MTYKIRKMENQEICTPNCCLIVTSFSYVHIKNEKTLNINYSGIERAMFGVSFMNRMSNEDIRKKKKST